jgi:hypothetical protein
MREIPGFSIKYSLPPNHRISRDDKIGGTADGDGSPFAAGIFEGESLGPGVVIFRFPGTGDIDLKIPPGLPHQIDTTRRGGGENNAGEAHAESALLLVGIVFATDSLEALAHGAGGVGARIDLGGDAPNQRNKSGCAQTDQGDAGIPAGGLTNAIGDEKSRAESDGDLRKTHNPRDW